MIRCNNCATNNIDGSEYCDECGMRLDISPPPRQRKRDATPIYQPPSAVEPDALRSQTLDTPLPSPPSFTTSTSVPKPAMPARDRRPAVDSRISNVNARRSHTNERSGPAFKSNERRADHALPPPSPQTYALSSPEPTGDLDSGGGSLQERDVSRAMARLIIERGGRIGKEFPIIGIETNIGRWDADSGIFPDVDLDEDDAEAKVSRRHARIVNHNSQFFIEDLGSTNGTFVNRGRRLLPGKRHMLQNGDEVIVGKTFLKFQILK